MTTKTLRITYRDDRLHERGRETLVRAADGAEFEPLIQVNVTEPHDLARLVSEETLELLTAIVEDEPETISDLAAVVDRDYRSVHRNLSELEEFGVVEFESHDGGKRPTLRAGADELELEITVEKSDVGEGTGRSASV